MYDLLPKAGYALTSKKICVRTLVVLLFLGHAFVRRQELAGVFLLAFLDGRLLFLLLQVALAGAALVLLEEVLACRQLLVHLAARTVVIQ